MLELAISLKKLKFLMRQLLALADLRTVDYVGNIMPDPVPLNEDANRNDDVPYDSEVEHVDKLGEHKGGGFCSQT